MPNETHGTPRAVRIDTAKLTSVAALERLCFPNPWSESALALLTGETGVGFAVVKDGEVLSYCGMMTVLDEGQITNIATHPSTRRRGFGEQIVRALCDFARERGLGEIFLEVRASNSGAIALYTKLGFERVGERRGFYRAPLEDAVIMKINLQ